MPNISAIHIGAVLAVVAFAGSPATAEDFFAGKTIAISIGSAAGGSYDAYARLMARHMGQHIAGAPTLVPKNMPGAAGTRAAAYVYNVAAKDGTQLGATLNSIPVTQLLRPKKAKYDVGKFNWIGTAASPANVLAVWHGAGVRTLEDAKKKEVLIGATTAGTTMEMYPLMANRLFGSKFKVVLGYKGGKDVNLAMEKGEVQGRGSNSWLSYTFQNPDWVKDGKIIPLFQMTLTRDDQLKSTPALIEFARTDEERQVVSLLATTETIGRSMMAPPGVPADRVTVLRKAFMDALRDSKLRADAARAKLEIQPIEGAALQQMVEGISRAPAKIVARFKAAVTSEKTRQGQ
ncbi:MAG: Bug family tripartite tricarboxylate transporter substrate binding protein [Alphaproteobacteria bacterium]